MEVGMPVSSRRAGGPEVALGEGFWGDRARLGGGNFYLGIFALGRPSALSPEWEIVPESGKSWCLKVVRAV